MSHDGRNAQTHGGLLFFSTRGLRVDVNQRGNSAEEEMLICMTSG